MDDDCMKDPRAQMRCATFVRPIVAQPLMMPPVSVPAPTPAPTPPNNGH